MLQIVLGSLQVGSSWLSFMHCIVFVVQLKHGIFSVSHTAWYNTTQHCMVQPSQYLSILGAFVCTRTPKAFELYEQCYHNLLLTAFVSLLTMFELSLCDNVMNQQVCYNRSVTTTSLFAAMVVPCKSFCGAEVHGGIIAPEGVPAAQPPPLAALPLHSHNPLLRLSSRSS